MHVYVHMHMFMHMCTSTCTYPYTHLSRQSAANLVFAFGLLGAWRSMGLNSQREESNTSSAKPRSPELTVIFGGFAPRQTLNKIRICPP